MHYMTLLSLFVFSGATLSADGYIAQAGTLCKNAYATAGALYSVGLQKCSESSLTLRDATSVSALFVKDNPKEAALAAAVVATVVYYRKAIINAIKDAAPLIGGATLGLGCYLIGKNIGFAQGYTFEMTHSGQLLPASVGFWF